ncbi:hypothetical protein CTI12_AA297290 [Artemisia annua]|uniref:Uncharacterized protein n=1 Tax=Artemisia annua TaxID=35608 RepID=A0A2U1N7T1_ARTAN|nr:hypothetical protein CTI12_AA297290 [Artemisia annua]
MAFTKTFGVMFLCFSLCLVFSSADGNAPLSAYEVLQSYNLPVGVLPAGVAGYTLDSNSGQFWVNLTNECKFNEGGHKIKYESIITGVITQNNLGDLDGVKVKTAFFWSSIKNVNRDQDQLGFKVGIFGTKSFPISDFSYSPECYY